MSLPLLMTISYAIGVATAFLCLTSLRRNARRHREAGDALLHALVLQSIGGLERENAALLAGGDDPDELAAVAAAEALLWEHQVRRAS
jgi:hypothetical protein